MSKKAQSISINTIIIAAIALAVLVVLFVIFTGRISLFSKGVGETTTCEQACKSAGYKDFKLVGESVVSNEGCGGSNYILLQGYSEIQGGTRMKCCCAP